MSLSRQDAFYLARVLVGLPVAGVDAHPYLAALVTTGAIADANQVLAVLGADALKAVLAEDPHTPPTPPATPHPGVEIPPLPENVPPRAEDREAGREVGIWQQRYVAWAAATANQSPLSYHEAIGLWLAGLALGRRVYAHAPWDKKIFPNLYVMLLGETTYYRKSTAYSLGEQLIHAAMPHMLLPQPGSAEQFTRMLAGKMPDNFGELAPQDKDRLLAGRAFAAARGLIWDELSGLFGSAKKDFMAGFKQNLLRAYDCPDLMDWETGKHGRTVVRDCALSILGATTPADLGLVVSDENWRDGLLARFVMVMPEPDFADRPPLAAPDAATQTALATGLRQMHAALPAPDISEDPTAPIPLTDPPRSLAFHAWPEATAYGDALRALCNPDSEQLDDRLYGFYGRLHTLAIKLAVIIAMMDWAQRARPGAPLPAVERAHWAKAWAIAEGWRASLHYVIDTLDISAAVRLEQADDRKVLALLRKYGPAGTSGSELLKFSKIGEERFVKALRRLVNGGEIDPVEVPAGRKCKDWYAAIF